MKKHDEMQKKNMAAMHKDTQQYLKQQQDAQQTQFLCSQNTWLNPLSFTFNSTLHFNFYPKSQATETERNKLTGINLLRVCVLWCSRCSNSRAWY